MHWYKCKRASEQLSQNCSTAVRPFFYFGSVYPSLTFTTLFSQGLIAKTLALVGLTFQVCIRSPIWAAALRSVPCRIKFVLISLLPPLCCRKNT